MADIIVLVECGGVYVGEVECRFRERRSEGKDGGGSEEVHLLDGIRDEPLSIGIRVARRRKGV